MNDYQKFFNIHNASESVLKALKQDFTLLALSILYNCGCKREYANTITAALYHSMSHNYVFYHTPVHIMSIFSFVKEHSIELNQTEQLALLFHDSIYRPGSKSNEIFSAEFMGSLLDSTGINEQLIVMAKKVILTTSEHLHFCVDPYCETVMDLDMSGFSASPGIYNLQGTLIEHEFYPDHYSLSDFLNGRLKFLKTLQGKPSIYRTEFFLKNLEAKAQMNLSNSIKEVERRMEVEL
jgi:predicted metal-dependent HD superfamily phosphohydrolase